MALRDAIVAFPAEREPDGNRFVLHHHYLGVVLVAGGAVAVGSGLATILAAVAYVAMLQLWADHLRPRLGALLALTATPVAAVVIVAAAGDRALPAALAALGSVLAADDAIAHAFGLATPITTVYERVVRPRLAGVAVRLLLG